MYRSGSDVIRNDNFSRFFDDLVVNYALSAKLSSKFHVPHFISSPYKPVLSLPSNDGLSFRIVGDDYKRMDFGTITNATLGKVFRIIGQTSQNTVSLIGQPINYTKKTISLTLSNILKYGNSSRYPISDDPPVHFKFKVHGDKSDYFVDFVQGIFGGRGWDQNSTYYVGVCP